MITDAIGLDFFTRYLRTEFSEENIEFWQDCNLFMHLQNPEQKVCCEPHARCDCLSSMPSLRLLQMAEAKQLAQTYVYQDAPRQINITSSTYQAVCAAVKTCPSLRFA